jgi:hypothetical protein
MWTLDGLDYSVTKNFLIVSRDLGLGFDLLQEFINTFDLLSPSFEAFTVVKLHLLIRGIELFNDYLSLFLDIFESVPIPSENTDSHWLKSLDLFLEAFVFISELVIFLRGEVVAMLINHHLSVLLLLQDEILVRHRDDAFQFLQLVSAHFLWRLCIELCKVGR